MNIEHYIREGEKRSEKYLLPKDIGITSRQVNYWKGRKVLPFFEDNKHGKMDIYQAIWLSIILGPSWPFTDGAAASMAGPDWKGPQDRLGIDL